MTNGQHLGIKIKTKQKKKKEKIKTIQMCFYFLSEIVLLVYDKHNILTQLTLTVSLKEN